jgi:hypothetical protein
VQNKVKKPGLILKLTAFYVCWRSKMAIVSYVDDHYATKVSLGQWIRASYIQYTIIRHTEAFLTEVEYALYERIPTPS